LSPITDRYFGDGAYWMVALLALLLLGSWTLSIFFTPLAPRRRFVIALLRLLVIITLLLVMLRPTHVSTEFEKQSATLVFLLDQSRSMLVEDTASGDSRWEKMAEIVADASGPLKRLRDEKSVEIKAYAFDSGAESVDLDNLFAEDKQPEGTESAYGESIREVLQREDGKRLIGVVLLGDGAEQTAGVATSDPEKMARQLGRLGCPLFTVPFGERKGARRVRDVAVESMPDDLVVFAKNRLNISGSLQISGYVNRDIPLQLLVEAPDGKQKVVASDVVRSSGNGEQIPFEIGYIPETAGQYKILVRAVPQEGEVTTTNNELPAILTVLEGGLRVLYIQGELRREQRFLRRALAASPDIDVTLLTLDVRDRENWPRKDLQHHFEPGAYDVTILGDVDSRAFYPGDSSENRPADLLALKNAVLEGAGLLMLGGWHSFRPGGYHLTPLAEVAPVEMDARVDRFVIQNYGEPIDKSLHLPGPLQMRPSAPWGLQSPMMRIAPENENMASWLELPPLSGANRFRDIREGARLLADDGQQNPLLVSGEPGGRVLAFAGDSTWRWVMQGYGDLHRRFWRQVVLWLARKEEQKTGNVWVELDGRRFTPGQRVTFHTGAKSPAGDPLADLRLTAHVVEPDGTHRDVRLVRSGADFSGTVRDCQTPGTYRIEVEAQSGDHSVGTDSEEFFLYAKDRELSGTTSDPAMLESLASHTLQVGGRSLAPEELSGLLVELAEQPMELKQRVRTTATYWDRWYVLVILIGLLGTEWFLRKRWRLV
jgi:uncharacterized membrane protein